MNEVEGLPVRLCRSAFLRRRGGFRLRRDGYGGRDGGQAGTEIEFCSAMCQTHSFWERFGRGMLGKGMGKRRCLEVIPLPNIPLPPPAFPFSIFLLLAAGRAVIFALLGGGSVGSSSPIRLGSRQSKSGSNRCGGPICPQIGRKYFTMNGLTNKLLFGRSNPVKVNQGCLNCGNRNSNLKAPEDWRTPKRFAQFDKRPRTRSVLDCGGPPPLFQSN